MSAVRRRNPSLRGIGPKRSPLGLAADPGGLPLYKNGVLVGGIGVESNGVYGIDRDITDIDENAEELVAVAGASGFAAPADIRCHLLLRRHYGTRGVRSFQSQGFAGSTTRVMCTLDRFKRFCEFLAEHISGEQLLSRHKSPVF